MRGWDEANGIGSNLLQRVDHVSHLAWLVRDDCRALLGQLFAVRIIGMQGEAGNRVDALREVLISKEEFGQEVAGMAVDGGDAEFARHGDCSSVRCRS